ncbi:MAG: protein-L-isoaspartate(D-aspartate) O-methyltransferase [Acidobacteria bacterium]|nr:protein-L-isoaspartate(D-aspartate) O-methyltransferase [Acidobacteriota bacterium]
MNNHLPATQRTFDTEDFARQREKMVNEQLRARDIKDERVLAAMLKVPRHEFVTPEFTELAYQDGALPIRQGQTISQPYIVAHMTELLELRAGDRVLEVGTGSGYQAAVLAEIAAEVFTIEIIPELQREASEILGKLGYTNIRFRVGDGYAGWPEHAPFDKIIVTAAPEDIPKPLIDQLTDGGRLVIPVGGINQELVVVDKEKSGVTRRSSIPVRFVPMTGKAQE